MSNKFEDSKHSGVHLRLHKMTGDWEGNTKTWFEPDVVADESPMYGTIRSILDGRFIMHEYKGKLQGQPFEGIAIYGNSLGTDKFQAAWIDSFHNGTAIMFSEGQQGAGNFSVLGSYSYAAPDGMQNWGWRTEIQMASDDELVITAYNITPQGDEAKATETIYKRVK